jgi:hypothetical protein
MAKRSAQNEAQRHPSKKHSAKASARMKTHLI